MDQAVACSAVRLTEKRQKAKVGDVFRLSPARGIFLWGRLMKRACFFGLNAEFNLVYIYDAVSAERPGSEALSPNNLMFGPCIVNNLGFSRGYWEIVASEPLRAKDTLPEHRFVRFRGTGNSEDYDLVDETGTKIKVAHSPADKFLSQSGFQNYNSVDWRVQGSLRTRGILPVV
jgi:hypothetical protein